MDLDQLRQLLELVRTHGFSEFELEHEGLRLKVRTGLAEPVPAAPPAAAVAMPGETVATGALKPVGPAGLPAAEAAPDVGGDAEVELAIVKSPIVGTFYRSAEPGAQPFVDVGALVKKGQVLCIIEAMKLMNEIDCEYDGEIVNIYVENGQPVQYGERLFAIRTR